MRVACRLAVDVDEILVPVVDLRQRLKQTPEVNLRSPHGSRYQIKRIDTYAERLPRLERSPHLVFARDDFQTMLRNPVTRFDFQCAC